MCIEFADTTVYHKMKWRPPYAAPSFVTRLIYPPWDLLRSEVDYVSDFLQIFFLGIFSAFF